MGTSRESLAPEGIQTGLLQSTTFHIGIDLRLHDGKGTSTGGFYRATKDRVPSLQSCDFGVTARPWSSTQGCGVKGT
jgi:hypothetical protein